jgi:hypothetical protein
MGVQLSLLQKSSIVLGIIIIIYFIVIGAYIGTNKNSTSSSVSSDTNNSSPPIFTNSPVTNPPVTNSPVTNPPVISTPLPTSPSIFHLGFDTVPPPGPDNAPSNFYRLGCEAALSSGLFPFTEFNTTGTFHSGTLQDYYTYDQWGYSGATDQYNCGWSLSGKKTCPPDPKPNIPWSDEQCDVCATASRDPNCLWTQASNSCYQTVGRYDIVNGKIISQNVTFVPTYHGMDISQCFYNPQGNFNDMKLCCDPLVM